MPLGILKSLQKLLGPLRIENDVNWYFVGELQNSKAAKKDSLSMLFPHCFVWNIYIHF